MKFSSALTMTTVLSILSATHGAPVPSTQEGPSTVPLHGHYRRASSVSELAGREYTGNSLMDTLHYAYEPGSHIKTLVNFVKRQIGATQSTNPTTDSTHQATSDSVPEHDRPSEAANNGGTGLMGGGMSSLQDAGFAFELGEGIRAP